MQTAYIGHSGAAQPEGGLGTVEIAFLLLFPGFFFYQTLVAFLRMNAFLGGFFGVVSVALLVPIGLRYLGVVKAARYRVASTDMQFGFFLAYFLVIVAINAAFGADGAIVRGHLASIMYFFNIFVIFKTIDFSDRRTMQASVASLLLMSAIIFYFSRDGIFFPGDMGDPEGEASVATYQEFARSYALTLLPVVCYTRRAALRAVLHCVGVLALFINGSRSELVAVLLVLPLVELYWSRSRLHLLAAIVLALAVAHRYADLAIHSLMPESRVWELFDLSRSGSWNARHELEERAVRTIAEHPLLGAFASYPPGEYSHNILSAWVDLGLFGFAYMLFMLGRPTLGLLAGGFFRRARSSQFLLALSLLVVSLVLLVTAKTFDDMFAGAALGAYANYRSRRREAWRGSNP